MPLLLSLIISEQLASPDPQVQSFGYSTTPVTAVLSHNFTDKAPIRPTPSNIPGSHKPAPPAPRRVSFHPQLRRRPSSRTGVVSTPSRPGHHEGTQAARQPRTRAGYLAAHCSATRTPDRTWPRDMSRTVKTQLV